MFQYEITIAAWTRRGVPRVHTAITISHILQYITVRTRTKYPAGSGAGSTMDCTNKDLYTKDGRSPGLLRSNYYRLFGHRRHYFFFLLRRTSARDTRCFVLLFYLSPSRVRVFALFFLFLFFFFSLGVAKTLTVTPIIGRRCREETGARARTHVYLCTYTWTAHASPPSICFH